MVSIETISPIVNAVGGRCIWMEVSAAGMHIRKALACGTSAVLVGRPIIWGLTVHGSQGVKKVREMLQEERSTAIALSGCPSLANIDRSLVSGHICYDTTI